MQEAGDRYGGENEVECMRERGLRWKIMIVRELEECGRMRGEKRNGLQGFTMGLHGVDVMGDFVRGIFTLEGLLR